MSTRSARVLSWPLVVLATLSAVLGLVSNSGMRPGTTGATIGQAFLTARTESVERTGNRSVRPFAGTTWQAARTVVGAVLTVDESPQREELLGPPNPPTLVAPGFLAVRPIASPIRELRPAWSALVGSRGPP